MSEEILEEIKEEEPKEKKENKSEIDYDKVAEILDKRSGGILKSYFKDQGLSEDEMKTAIETFKNSRTERSDKSLKDLEETKNKFSDLQARYLQEKLDNEAYRQAIEMGIDKKNISYIIKLADTKTALNENGEVNVEELKKSISKVIDDVPAFKAQPQNQGFKIGANTDDQGKTNDKLFDFKFTGVRKQKQ